MGKVGRLEVICGPMFCGKTEELIRRIRRAQIARKRVQVFNHKLDERYSKNSIASHNGVTFEATAVTSPSQILRKLGSKTSIVAIDESQWFGPKLVRTVRKLMKQGKTVFVAGLATTYEGEPFEPMPQLMSIADKVDKLTAICTRCGRDAIFHKKVRGKREKDPLKPHKTLAGPANEYEARCRGCFSKK